MKIIAFISVIWLSCVVFVSCKKPGSTITGGGRGGTSVISVSGEHHGDLLDTCIIYIKYGTLNEPADNVYDDSAVCVLADNVPVAIFDSLTVGLYYLEAVGYHGAYSPPNVKGGVPCTISKSGSTTNLVIPTYQYIL